MWLLRQKKSRLRYHPNSFDMMAWFDPACISPLYQSHSHANEEKHLSLLHAEKGNIKKLLFRTTESTTSSLSSYLVKWKRW